MTECWACSLWAHWTNMHAANCTVHGAQGQDYPICKTYDKAKAVMSPIWVMLINCVVTVITDDGWPHMSLISSWHRKTHLLQGMSANQDGGETKIFTCVQEYTKPLCCCSPHSEGSRNASLETCPAQTAVSCPAERKMTSAVHFLTNLSFRWRFGGFKVKFNIFTCNIEFHPPRATNNVFIHC